ncbi:hypothetical protein BRD03_11210 [Halobacteriales archaeon QS_9_68_17]|nr:MAG: hypothetical protein BRD03_11210 [Halobacteriales archaeon QS_9_68_17]
MLREYAHSVAEAEWPDSLASASERASAAAADAYARSPLATRRLPPVPNGVVAVALVAVLFGAAAASALAVAVALAVLPAVPALQAVVVATGAANVFVGLPLVAVKAAEVVAERL